MTDQELENPLVCTEILVGGSTAERKTVELAIQCGTLLGREKSTRHFAVCAIAHSRISLEFFHAFLGSARKGPSPERATILAQSDEERHYELEKFCGKKSAKQPALKCNRLDFEQSLVRKSEFSLIFGEDGSIRGMALSALFAGKAAAIGGPGKFFDIEREIIAEGIRGFKHQDPLFFSTAEEFMAIMNGTVRSVSPFKMAFYEKRQHE